MAAEDEISAALRGTNTAQAGAEGVSVVEMRLCFGCFDGNSGRLEGRNGAGQQLFAADIAQVLGSIPCFTAQSLVATGSGLVQVGSLTPGLRVITRDHGMQELRWVGKRTFGWKDLGLNPLLRPVRIAAGALGNGLPERDMVVSPNHHFLTSKSGEGEGGERLTMARDMVGRPGITTEICSSIEYWQLLFDKHELVLSDGCWSETFLPTTRNLAALDDDGRQSALIAVPDLQGGESASYEAARPFAKVGSAA
ncbi:Hint domain-containing protein [Rhodobacter sp. JA431]|uniref:Hint domain-containing protein n=1 Tax=Rhodobacter sp. JA431 TaxID=570013 RepID=UPI000BD64A83|nr:Hint domain-containing protein [Rhodobacter sp. JA431]SOB97776.1 Hint domain-containing protein [Rhodobacter sp. JA431]